MGFFNLDEPATGLFSSGEPIKLIPENTEALAAIDEAKWSDYNGEAYISLRWSILAPDEYKGRKIFQKIKVSADGKKGETARRMLAAIDKNAGGSLLAADVYPTDDSLTSALVGKPMVIKIMTWELEGGDGKLKQGNWVSAVSPRTGDAPPASLPVAGSHAAPKQAARPTVSLTDDDDLPF